MKLLAACSRIDPGLIAFAVVVFVVLLLGAFTAGAVWAEGDEP